MLVEEVPVSALAVRVKALVGRVKELRSKRRGGDDDGGQPALEVGGKEEVDGDVRVNGGLEGESRKDR